MQQRGKLELRSIVYYGLVVRSSLFSRLLLFSFDDQVGPDKTIKCNILPTITDFYSFPF